jgi:hypothetical protein
VRHLIVEILGTVPKGQVVHLQELYSRIYGKFPKECRQLGITGKQRMEPTWKNEIRRGLHLAINRGLIKHVGTPKSREWQRI